jgi:hypothetical protein
MEKTTIVLIILLVVMGMILPNSALAVSKDNKNDAIDGNSNDGNAGFGNNNKDNNPTDENAGIGNNDKDKKEDNKKDDNKKDDNKKGDNKKDDNKKDDNKKDDNSDDDNGDGIIIVPYPVVTATPDPVVTATPDPVVTATPDPIVVDTPTPLVINDGNGNEYNHGGFGGSLYGTCDCDRLRILTMLKAKSDDKDSLFVFTRKINNFAWDSLKTTPSEMQTYCESQGFNMAPSNTYFEWKPAN